MRPDGQKGLKAVQRSSKLIWVFKGSANCDPVVAPREMLSAALGVGQ